ncbi:hypothetical protein C6N75_15840 [Streptomyces solincola]|uniref:Uncharacterized protein n=1 Tax=Streptomyces solincola TaxID=2100817 RepID=A0A2S9PV04_9ACTN|nr:hypothetical protein [Streptomyces solincola]PRH78260.1 hypothetical protein C6N75_15840 [Streptomyces solincola]
MPETSASHLRALAADAKALQQRLHDALAGMDDPAPTVSFQLGEAHGSLGAAAQSLEAASQARSA